MKQAVRTVVFWMHLSAGLTAGSIVAVMAITGAALAFQPQLLEWAERSTRQVVASRPDAPRLAVDELLARARAFRPAAAPTAVTLEADPRAAARVTTGRDGVHVDPYTGEVRELGGQRWRSFFQVMVEWHRWLGREGDGRAVGRAITGVANAAFFFLALSGLYLWWPRRWNARVIRLSTWFTRGLTGRARDWNWHNVIGFWSLPVLLVVTSSGMIISYRWASNLIYVLAGERPPATAGPGAAAPVSVPVPPPAAKPLPLQALVAAAQAAVPAWKTITVRLGRPPVRGDGAAERNSRTGGNRAGAQALAISIKEQGAWPLFATAQLSLDPFTGKILRQEGYHGYGRGRQIRFWLRFLHTGEALGWPGQLAAAAASLGATVLVWTGFALAWRRFSRRRSRCSRG